MSDKDNPFTIDRKHNVYNFPGLLFVYWDVKARVLEIMVFERKVFYFYLPEGDK
jgi:hypothetical protein